jgi:hypothetical protein
MIGSSTDDVNPPGPVQLYVAPAIVFAVRRILFPVQTGVLLPAVGVVGAGLTMTDVVPAALVQPPAVTVILYVPAIATVADAIVGFCKVDV